MSSISEDDSGPSLKELVTKNLEANGVLGKLQAQLRASVFLIMEDQCNEKNIPFINEKSKQILSTTNGKLAVSIIQDFLQCLNLDFTLAVFNPESNSPVIEHGINRKYLDAEFSKCCLSKDSKKPFLLDLIEECQKNSISLESKNNFTKSSSRMESNDLQFNRPQQSNSLINDLRNASQSGQSCSVKNDLTNNLSQLKHNDSVKHDVIQNFGQSKQSDSVKQNVIQNFNQSKQSESIKNDLIQNFNQLDKRILCDAQKDDESSTLTLSSETSEKDTLAGLDKEYDDDFSSLGEIKNLEIDNNVATSNNNEKSTSSNSNNEIKIKNDETNKEIRPINFLGHPNIESDNNLIIQLDKHNCGSENLYDNQTSSSVSEVDKNSVKIGKNSIMIDKNSTKDLKGLKQKVHAKLNEIKNSESHLTIAEMEKVKTNKEKNIEIEAVKATSGERNTEMVTVKETSRKNNTEIQEIKATGGEKNTEMEAVKAISGEINAEIEGVKTTIGENNTEREAVKATSKEKSTEFEEVKVASREKSTETEAESEKYKENEITKEVKKNQSEDEKDTEITKDEISEEIEENIDSLLQRSSSSSLNQTDDLSASKNSKIADYEETL